MQEQISWDPSLVKKFGSSNHYKLLNQLRIEVKKYPLTKNKSPKDNKEKNVTAKDNLNATQSIESNSLRSNTTNYDNNINQTSTIYKSNHIPYKIKSNSKSVDQSIEIQNKVDDKKYSESTKSNISFNNSKNFNIYNNKFNDYSSNSEKFNYQVGNTFSKDNEPLDSLTFKDRLNKIDMK
tara:strand:+ start:26165 stop:26704 length:540 start_codon:yes stop_codon:yes gene_type:complete